MTYKKLILIFVLLPLSSFGFGPIAHRSIGLIAEANLTPKAQAMIRQLLGQESLADVANWADQVRGDGKYYQQANWYHFEKMNDGINYINHLKSMPQDQRLKGGSIVAILAGFDALRSPQTPPQERRDALKFLVHFVGDIHQPLHTGRIEDMGGNKIEVSWYGYPSNLHSVWDSGLIIVGHSDIITPNTPVENQSVMYARYLITKFSKQPVNFAMDTEMWLNESLGIRTSAYSSTYATNQPLYLQQQLPIVDFRVYQAGIRLAAALNQIFAQAPVQNVEKELWQKVVSVLGDFRKYIFFRP